MPLREIVVGRDKEDLEKYGSQGTIFLGKNIVGTGEEAHLTNPVSMDVARPHVVLCVGKRGQGKCLLPKEEVKLFDGSSIEIEKLFERCRKSAKKIKSDGKEELFKLKNEVELISLDNKLRICINSASHIYRKKIDEKIIKIKTATGKEINVTRDHPFLISKLGWVNAEKLNKESYIALPRKLPQKGVELNFENHGKEVSFPMWSQTKGEILNFLKDKDWIYAAKIKEKLGFDPYKSLKKLENINLVDSMASSPLKYKLTEDGKEFLNEMKNEKIFRFFPSSKPISIPDNGVNLSKFMAYLIAEGTEIETENTFRFIFSNHDKEKIKDFEKISYSLFSLKPKPMKNAVYTDSKNLKHFLEINGYFCGWKSRNKKIPEFLMKANKDILSIFLQTFFDCEASFNRCEIELSSASKKIIDQISELLLRFGIISRVKIKSRYAANTKKRIRRDYSILRISSKTELQKFYEKIGFGDRKKRQKLEDYLIKKSNPNVDIIPDVGDLLTKIREDLELPRTKIGIKQSVKAYEEGKYNPSRRHLDKYLKKYEERIKELKEIKKRLEKGRTEKEIIKAVHKTFLTWKKISEKLGLTYSSKIILDCKKHIKQVRKIVLNHVNNILDNENLYKNLNKVKNLINSDIFWDKIVAIEEMNYKGWVYDLTVPETHNFVAGKNGGIICHNSYTGCVVAEEIAMLPEELRNKLSVLMIDTMGIFWSMKSPNEKQFSLLSKWNLKPRSFDVDVFIPEGFEEKFKKADIPFDHIFSIKASDLGLEDWLMAFGISLIEPLGILLDRIVKKLKKTGQDFGIDDIIETIKKDERSDEKEKQALENRFSSARDWGIFSEKGTKISEFLKPGKISILDLSFFSQLGEGWSVRSLLVGLLARKIYRIRTEARRKEEISTIAGKKEMKVPLTWIIIDEAHQFLAAHGETAASGPLLTLVKQGRQPGISCFFITQRPNKLHETAIAQSDLVISHRLTAKPDLDALRNIMQTYLMFDINKYINDLPRKKGTAILLDDNSERIYPIQVRPRLSWHGGGTPSILEKEI